MGYTITMETLINYKYLFKNNLDAWHYSINIEN